MGSFAVTFMENLSYKFVSREYVKALMNRALVDPLGAGQALSELSRDNPRMKQVENHTNTFLKSLEVLEIGLSKHITYLTQVTTGKF